MNNNTYEGYEYQPSEPSQKSLQQNGQHYSNREYTFAQSQHDRQGNQSQDNSNIDKLKNNILPQNKKKASSQPSNYLSKLKQQYAPLQSTQSTHHSQHNKSIDNEQMTYEQLQIYSNLLKLELEKKLIQEGEYNMNKNGKNVDLYIELQQQKQQYEQEINKQKIIIHNLENDVHLIQDLKNYVTKYQMQNETLSKSMEEAVKNVEYLTKTINQLEQEKDSLLDYVDKQKEIAESLKLENDQMIEQYKNSQLIISQLQEQINSYNKEMIDKEEFIKELSQLKQVKNINLQEEIQRYQLQITELQNQIADYESANKDLSRKFNNSVSQIQQIIRQSEERQSQIQFTQQQDNHSVCEFDSNLKSSRNYSNNLIQKQQQGLDQMVKINKQNLIDYQQQLQLHQQLGQLQEKSNTQINQIENLQSQLITYQSQQDILISQNSFLQNDLMLKNKEILELQQQQQKLQFEKNDIEGQLQDQIIEQNTLNQGLNIKLQEQTQKVQEVSQQQVKYNALQIKHDADIEYYEKIIEEFNTQINKIQIKLDDLVSILLQENFGKSKDKECSTRTILLSIELIESLLSNKQILIPKQQKLIHDNYPQLNTSNQQNTTILNFSSSSPTNYISQFSKPLQNDNYDSQRKNSLNFNGSNSLNKPYLIKRNYFL